MLQDLLTSHQITDLEITRLPTNECMSALQTSSEGNLSLLSHCMLMCVGRDEIIFGLISLSDSLR
jgi:hypothetical protein